MESSALYSRIRFLRHLYLGLISLSKQDLSEGQRCLNAAKEQIDNVKGTTGLGVQADEAGNMIGRYRKSVSYFPAKTEMGIPSKKNKHLTKHLKKRARTRFLTRTNTYTTRLIGFLARTDL